MKTVVIFNMGEEGVKLYLEDGDLTCFEGVEVNSTETGFEDELSEKEFANLVSSEDARIAILNGALIVQCAFFY